jgi:hypothetical protein
MEALTFAVMCLSNIACVIIGAKMGRASAMGEEIKLPSVNPVEAVRKHEAKKVADAEQSKIDTIMANIEAYDGTAYGQKDIPGG